MKHGVPIATPKALASLLHAIAQPSLLLITTAGFPTKEGVSTLSQDAKKLLQSIIANISAAILFMDDPSHDAPNLKRRVFY